MSALYDVGDTARCTAKVKDQAGTMRDPATLSFELTQPSGVVVTYAWPANPEVVRVTTGDFYIDVPIQEQNGEPYKYKWTSAGGAQPVPAVKRGELPVRHP